MDKATRDAISKFISTQQAADRLGVKRWQAHHLAKTGKLEAVHIGGTWLIYAPSVDAYIRARDVEQPNNSKS